MAPDLGLVDPVLVGLALVGAAIVWIGRARDVDRRPAAPYPLTDDLTATSPGVRTRALWLIPALRVLALVALAVAMARPVSLRGGETVRAAGVAIMFAVDRAWSMKERIEFDGRRMSRIGVVKRLFREFVEGNGDDLPGRPHDLIGLVTFAKFAETVCPLVRNREALTGLVDSIRLVDPTVNRYEAGTAIGEGLELAAARLTGVDDREERLDERTTATIEGRAIVLLTDGDENAGDVSALDAARLCADMGIRIHVIGVAGGEPRTRLGRATEPTYRFNEGDLKEVAERTGGVYRVATSADSLRAIYREIDALEKTEVLTSSFVARDERFRWVAGLAVGVLLLECLLGATVLRRSP